VIGGVYVAALVSQLTRFMEMVCLLAAPLGAVHGDARRAAGAAVSRGSKLDDYRLSEELRSLRRSSHARPFQRAASRHTISWTDACSTETYHHMHVYFNVYFWFRVVFIHFVPCSALVVFTAALSCAMQKAKRRRQQLLQLNRRQEFLRMQVRHCH